MNTQTRVLHAHIHTHTRCVCIRLKKIFFFFPVPPNAPSSIKVFTERNMAAVNWTAPVFPGAFFSK